MAGAKGTSIEFSDITPSDIGAALTLHNHSASQITSGTLPLIRGGTGVTSLSALKDLIGAKPETSFTVAILPNKNQYLSYDLTSEGFTYMLPRTIDLSQPFMMDLINIGTGFKIKASSSNIGATTMVYRVYLSDGTTKYQINGYSGCTNAQNVVMLPDDWAIAPLIENTTFSNTGAIRYKISGYQKDEYKEQWGSSVNSKVPPNIIADRIIVNGVNVSNGPAIVGLYASFYLNY